MSIVEESIRNLLRNLPVENCDIGEKQFYIVNTLVNSMDGSRVIGPLTSDMLNQRREMYKSIIKSMISDEERQNYPFVVYEVFAGCNVRRI